VSLERGPLWMRTKNGINKKSAFLIVKIRVVGKLRNKESLITKFKTIKK
jgi:hypothetical protein